MLSQSEIDQYRRTGYLVVEEVLDKAMLSRARQVIAELVAGAAQVSKHDSVYDLEPGHRPEAPRVRRIKTPHVNHPLFWEIARLPTLVGLLAQLLGRSGVRLHGSKINLKAPQYGSPVEWHQDWAFYPHTNDDILAVGVMLDDMLLENGPLLVMPGTHTGPVFDHHVEGYFSGAIDPSAVDLDFSQAVPLTAPTAALRIRRRRRLAAAGRQGLRRLQPTAGLGRTDHRTAPGRRAGAPAAAAVAASGLDLRKPDRSEEPVLHGRRARLARDSIARHQPCCRKENPPPPCGLLRGRSATRSVAGWGVDAGAPLPTQ
jgi:phytanoyl-CoA hydroxylase